MLNLAYTFIKLKSGEEHNLWLLGETAQENLQLEIDCFPGVEKAVLFLGTYDDVEDEKLPEILDRIDTWEEDDLNTHWYKIYGTSSYNTCQPLNSFYTAYRFLGHPKYIAIMRTLN